MPKGKKLFSNDGKTMRRAIMTGPGQIGFVDIPVPTPGPDEVLIKVHACAICTWEQRMYTGEEKYYPIAGGHEVSGVVEDKGDLVFGLEPGDHVSVAGLKRCYQCESCRRGYNNICENMYKMRDAQNPPGPGGFGDYVLRSGVDCYKIARDVPYEHAALTEPLACVTRSVQRAQLQPGERVVIVGAGIMGMLHLLLAKSYNAVVIVSEPNEQRRRKALELGAHHAFNPLEQDYVETVKALGGGQGANVTFICVAHHATVEPAVVASAQNGRVLCYTSFHPKGQKIQVDPDIFHKNEVTLTGTMSQTREDFYTAAELISNKLIDLEPLISATFPLDDIENAIKAALNVDTYRVLVAP